MVIEKKGMMFVLSSPSGAGKTTLTKKIAKRQENKNPYIISNNVLVPLNTGAEFFFF